MIWCQKLPSQIFPGSPGVRTQRFHCQGWSSIPGLTTKILQATRCSQNIYIYIYIWCALWPRHEAKKEKEDYSPCWLNSPLLPTDFALEFQSLQLIFGLWFPPLEVEPPVSWFSNCRMNKKSRDFNQMLKKIIIPGCPNSFLEIPHTDRNCL